MARAKQVLMIAVTVGLFSCILFMAFIVGSDALMDRRHGKQARAMIAAYRASASAGTVVKPAPVADAIRAMSGCRYSAPVMLRVRTQSGATYRYSAVGHPESGPNATSWTFKPLFVTDENGKFRDIP